MKKTFKEYREEAKHVEINHPNSSKDKKGNKSVGPKFENHAGEPIKQSEFLNYPNFKSYFLVSTKIYFNLGQFFISSSEDKNPIKTINNYY